MPNTQSSDDDLLLKRRARRRLLGAAAFAGFAAVVLPMVMQKEPKQQVQGIQFSIQGQDQTTFTPRIERQVNKGQSPKKSGEEPIEESAGKDIVQPAETHSEHTADNVDNAAAKVTEKAANHATSQKTPKTEKIVEQKTDKPKKREKLNKTPDKTLDKTPDKSAKTAEKKPEKTPEKTAEKPTESTAEKNGAKAQNTDAEHTAKRTRAEEARRAAAALAGKDVDTAGKAKEAKGKTSAEAEKPAKSSEHYVILIGTFSNTDNVKQLQEKLVGQGIRVFTEPIESGKKTRVRAGPFASRDAAEKAAQKMKQIGVNGVITGKP